MIGDTPSNPDHATEPAPDALPPAKSTPSAPEHVPAPEHGGRGGLDPTRYGDWEKNGRCIDF